MTSFINLLANDVWSDTDILNRTEAIIASEFPKIRYDILMRKVSRQAFGYVLTAQEQADLQHYKDISYLAGTLADIARADMALLQSALDYESAQQRLQQVDKAVGRVAVVEVPAIPAIIDLITGATTAAVPAIPAVSAIDPLPATVTSIDINGVATQIPNPALLVDAAERLAAQTVISNAKPETLALVTQRKQVQEH